MRRLTPALVMVLAACSTVPKNAPTPVPIKVRPSGDLIGLNVHDLGQRFGQPRFQVQEGPGTKLQWAGGGCVLDVYLYPPVGQHGNERVTYADARRPTGAEIDVRSCLTLMGR